MLHICEVEGEYLYYLIVLSAFQTQLFYQVKSWKNILMTK